MQKYLVPLRSFVFWLCWSFIVGGILITGPLLAPLAFHTLPVLMPDAPVHEFASLLFTLFFSRFLPGCALVFMLMTLLEGSGMVQHWKSYPKRAGIAALMLLVGNLLWIYGGFVVVPEMKSMSLDPELWAQASVRESFGQLHLLSDRLTKAGFAVTLIFPWFASVSRLITPQTAKR